MLHFIKVYTVCPKVPTIIKDQYSQFWKTLTCDFLNFVNHVMDSPILIGAICMKLVSIERNSCSNEVHMCFNSCGGQLDNVK